MNLSTVDSLIELLRRIRCEDPNIQSVVIERKRLPDKYVISLLDSVAKSKFVSRIKLSKVACSDDVARAIADCIATSLTLKEINLSKNRITDAGCLTIAQSLQETGKRSSLRRLNLEGNHIGDAGIQALCSALPGTNITSIKLGKNTFGVKAIKSIATLIKQNKSSLTSLDLRNIGIKSSSMGLIADALHFNTTLQYLCLNRNGICNTGAERLAEALRSNNYLKTLDIAHNPINDAGLAAFVEALQDNHNFTKLRINDTNISEDIRNKLWDLLLMNSFGPDLARQTKQAVESLSPVQPSDDCCICFDDPSNCILLPCQHSNCCESCARKMKCCHMCRSTIVKVLKSTS